MTIYITLSNGDILDRYEPPRFVRFAVRVAAGVRRAWRAVRYRPALGRIQLQGSTETVDSRTDDLVSALTNLGMKKREALAAARGACERAPGGDFDAVLREALQGRVAGRGVA